MCTANVVATLLNHGPHTTPLYTLIQFHFWLLLLPCPGALNLPPKEPENEPQQLPAPADRPPWPVNGGVSSRSYMLDGVPCHRATLVIDALDFGSIGLQPLAWQHTWSQPYRTPPGKDEVWVAELWCLLYQSSRKSSSNCETLCHNLQTPFQSIWNMLEMPKNIQ